MELLLSNFYTYDWIIFAAAGINVIIFLISLIQAGRLAAVVAPRINVSSKNADKAMKKAKQDSTYFSLYEKWQRAEFWYNLFCNLTGTFTLLGILGTVLALIHLVDSTAEVDLEFLGALTSTLWGIIFTILFKILDSAISFNLNLGERIAELVQISEYEEPSWRGKKKGTMELEDLDDPEDFDIPARKPASAFQRGGRKE